MLPIAILICLLAVMFAQRVIYRKYWDKNLKVNITFEQKRVIENEPIHLELEVENDKRLPLPSLMLIFSLPQEFQEINTNDIVAVDSWRRNEMFSLFSHQRVSRVLKFICRQRGVYSLDEYQVDNRSFFLDEEYAKTYPLDRQIFVYPAAVESGRFIEKFQSIYGTIMSNDFHYEDVFTIRGIREYQPFDSQKRINWNATAKLGRLMVNNYEYTTNRKVVIFLNLAVDQLSQERVIGEESIRLVKTWCMNLDKQGIQANVYTNGIDCMSGREVFVCKENLKKKYMETVNESLARIKIKDVSGRFSEEYRNLLRGFAKDHYILVISAYQHECFQQDLVDILKETGNLTWIVPVNTNSDYRPCAQLKGHTISWDVYWRKERANGIWHI